MRRARNAAIHDCASASVSLGHDAPSPPPPQTERDDAMGEENADVEVPKPRRRTRYSLSGKLNLTSQRENIRAMSDSAGKHDRANRTSEIRGPRAREFSAGIPIRFDRL